MGILDIQVTHSDSNKSHWLVTCFQWFRVWIQTAFHTHLFLPEEQGTLVSSDMPKITQHQIVFQVKISLGIGFFWLCFSHSLMKEKNYVFKNNLKYHSGVITHICPWLLHKNHRIMELFELIGTLKIIQYQLHWFHLPDGFLSCLHVITGRWLEQPLFTCVNVWNNLWMAPGN